ncbi:MAG: hypothetical protein Q8N51_08465, partial [Gammaproteobacteria bacterium]|nr:hypothetical protein [Gammaproteobacteria bacterium]
NYDRALHYVEQGLHQGWQGNWEARIRHLQKLAPPRSTKTTVVNLGGGHLTPPMSSSGFKSNPPVPVTTLERSVACSQCGQKMRIPATFTKTFGACVRCGNRVDIPSL